jgi:hypothetical protein
MTMTNKRIHLCAALAAALAATFAVAQNTSEGIAKLKDVKGNVLLSRESGLAAGGEAVRLVEHTRVITTANSEVTVVYDDGCEVKLKENQRFEVERDKPCAALIASVQSILVQPAAAIVAGPAFIWTAAPAIGGAGVGLGMLQDTRGKTPLSPN